jgi:hypothetical protein
MSSSTRGTSLLGPGGGVETLFRKFAGIIESCGVFDKFQKIEERFKGPLTICREKIALLNS